MKLIEVQSNGQNRRFSFDCHGVYTWVDVDQDGAWIDGTFKEGSEPHREQMELIKKYYP